MLKFEKLYSPKRFGKEKNYENGVRSEYQRDFDRLIFSSPFRRLQNKTQVFPLPGSSFVHNRLTHSLEVSTVGRSLGKLAGDRIAKENFTSDSEQYDFYKHELQNVLAAACLAHDIGNPAFGHSGESAISNYFVSNEGKYVNLFSEGKWKDLTNFEGNANALRILTAQFNGHLSGGQRLTFSTLATLLKYPCESLAADQDSVSKHTTKYGFFQSEKNQFLEIVNEFSLIQQNTSPIVFCRHPFVYLLEAADDITYTIVDFEDAHRIGILEFDETYLKLSEIIKCIGRKEDNLQEIDKKLNSVSNPNEKIAYLRSRAINALILQANDVFFQNIVAIMEGVFQESLLKIIKKTCKALQTVAETSYDKIYNHSTVVEIEMAGYNVMYELLSLFIPSVLKIEYQRTKLETKAISLISNQYGPFLDADDPYMKCIGVLDFVSGMTDLYATELYRKIKGIDIGKHR